MTKTETFCDICGEKVMPFGVTRMVLNKWEMRDMDLCKTCTNWLLDLIADRQTEKSTTREQFITNATLQ